jgi:(5-formylfuran-3-yl)methyl phosphate synthase
MKLSQVLIDTAIKDGTTLLDHCSLETLQRRLHQASELGIGVALAGSISFAMLPQLLALQPQWLGMRGALCSGPARTSAISLEKIRFAVHEVLAFGTTESNEV